MDDLLKDLGPDDRGAICLYLNDRNGTITLKAEELTCLLFKLLCEDAKIETGTELLVKCTDVVNNLLQSTRPRRSIRAESNFRQTRLDEWQPRKATTAATDQHKTVHARAIHPPHQPSVEPENTQEDPPSYESIQHTFTPLPGRRRGTHSVPPSLNTGRALASQSWTTPTPGPRQGNTRTQLPRPAILNGGSRLSQSGMQVRNSNTSELGTIVRKRTSEEQHGGPNSARHGHPPPPEAKQGRVRELPRQTSQMLTEILPNSRRRDDRDQGRIGPPRHS